jgi:hypothetical protein
MEEPTIVAHSVLGWHNLVIACRGLSFLSIELTEGWQEWNRTHRLQVHIAGVRPYCRLDIDTDCRNTIAKTR